MWDTIGLLSWGGLEQCTKIRSVATRSTSEKAASFPPKNYLVAIENYLFFLCKGPIEAHTFFAYVYEHSWYANNSHSVCLCFRLYASISLIFFKKFVNMSTSFLCASPYDRRTFQVTSPNGFLSPPMPDGLFCLCSPVSLTVQFKDVTWVWTPNNLVKMQKKLPHMVGDYSSVFLFPLFIKEKGNRTLNLVTINQRIVAVNPEIHWRKTNSTILTS